ncbi:McrB family protein [Peribacillus frigoritolerans]|uniref:McrB family protein n=1 Tax=Peribacillus frigoritolerans TaxID=450367 RepID=UPI0034270600
MTKNIYDEWRKNEENYLLNTLRHKYKDKKLTPKELEEFVTELRENVFGDKLYCRVDSFRPVSNGKSLVVDATIVNPTGERFLPCQHPFEENTTWKISSVIPLKKFDEKITVNDLFTVPYEGNRIPSATSLIQIDLRYFEKVELSFKESLLNHGGPALLEAATSLFSNDIEKAILLRFSQTHRSLLDIEKQKFEEDKQALDRKISRLNRRIKKIDDDEMDYEMRESKLNKQKFEWLVTMKKINEYLKENLYVLPQNEEEELHPWIPEEALQTLQSLIYHNSDDHLLYEERVIEMFLRSIQSNTLVILSGPSGTGKSSLVHAFSNAIKGAKSTFIAVQSSWTDNQDLLGYFNTIEKRFVPTAFMQALAEARHQPDQLHILCLDEMNLAHVEYYFSEFLSIRERKNPTLQLYAQRYFREARSYIDSYDTSISHDRSEIERYDNAIELVYDYPSEFFIPDNVRFVGTLNMDQTVKPLSPKVIDRSFVIELTHAKNRNETTDRLKAMPKKGVIDVTLDQLFEARPVTEGSQESVQKIMDLAEILESIPNARLYERGQKQLTSYLSYCTVVTDEHLDQLISMKVLPRISLMEHDQTGMEAFRTFLNMLKPFKESDLKAQKMSMQTRKIQFW